MDILAKICICIFRCVVWTGDGRVFFYNPSTRTSVWERPEDLLGRADVDKAIATTPEALAGTQLAKDDKPQVDIVMESSSSTADSVAAVSSLGITTTNRRHNTDSESSGDEGSGPKKPKLDVTTASSGMWLAKDNQRFKYLNNKMWFCLYLAVAVKQPEKNKDIGKEAAIEAEVRAARERALVPLETRVTSFKDMLKEKDVSCYLIR